MIGPVAFPDAEADLRTYLVAELAARSDTATVHTKVPNPRPPRFVRLVRAGGVRRDVVTDRPRFVVECWDSNSVAAAGLARTVRALIGAAAPGYVGAAWCDRVDDAGMASSPDVETGTPRYLITVELHLRGSPL